MELEKISVHAFIDKYDIKTDTGVPLDFFDHQFVWDIYSDFSPKLCIMKAAQVTMSTCAILKVLWAVKNKGIDAIYTLPTADDRNVFVGGKVNRLISQNPTLQEWTKDKDSVEQKQIGNNIVHFKGTWTEREAIMNPSDWNIHDEIDSSKQQIIEQMETRLQHSKLRWMHLFSHPSAPDYGVHKYWQLSDQKHWFITCPSCKDEHYLRWPESINQEKEVFVCIKCGFELSDDARRRGKWVKKFKDREWSGYWVSLLMCPWVSAKQILEYYRTKSPDYFWNKVLGLPYVGAGNKLTWESFIQNIAPKYVPDESEEVVLGIDTGLKLDYVMGDRYGLFHHATADSYDELDKHMERWPRAIAVIDAGGDLIGSRKFYERWRGRVFLCYSTADRKQNELFEWGEGDKYGQVRIDRNRTIQLVVDEFGDKRIPVHGEPDDWSDYWQDWKNLTRIAVTDPVTGEHKGYKWVRSGRDHKALSTIYWRVGMDKYGWGGAQVAERRVEVDETKDPLIEETLRQLKEGVDDWRS